MKTKSTYSLILNAQAEEKARTFFAHGVCSLVVLATALSIWSVATSAVRLPGDDVAPRQVERVIITRVDQPLIASTGK